MRTPTKAVISLVGAGAMGAALAARMHQNGAGTILSPLEGRSEETIQRAAACGIVSASYADIVKTATHILSVVPPGEALAVARTIASAYQQQNTRRALIFVDCNAVNTESVREISAVFSGTNVRFVDGSIIGLPPSETYNPGIFFAPSPDADMHWFEEFVGTLKGYGLNVFAMEGEGVSVGDASALKMAHSAIVKGTLGLMTSAVLAANASSPATARGLIHALEISQPRFVDLSDELLAEMIPKAYRFVKEMKEVGGFISAAGHSDEGRIFEEISELFGGIARSHEAHKRDPRSAEAGDVASILDFAQESSQTVAARASK
ncbi:hypothetical protein CYLTODRAFT_494599 [Cylindrobasidium torrendii FP15055 ss-10]|uniref:6-phosphogluconate dehydrogenase C-terminal domain-like protein n=1 Tax=Cylindrobasidium torrendii FP15055 ss-10 TaxID=1314674 RepID=A0A0D7AYY1_9AGAR|nr:hypothetical protein CYLTODRAFT_494599 [Cylindrobasidium torrendii FP15055 ss-10]